MAQLLLTAATGAASIVSKAGIGAFLARTVATTAASFAAGYVDRLIFGPKKRKVEGPRLDSFQVQASQEGAGLLRVYGRARVAGQLIWAANFKETVSETKESSGGKGGRPASQTTITEFVYSISFAVGLCEGVIDRIGRIWADGKPFDISKHNVRVYRGEETQNPDALIASVEGADTTPAFRGLAYVVFEDLPLKDFGNRIPQLAFEIERSLKTNDPDALENRLTAVSLIPASGEFVYGTSNVFRDVEEGVVVSENTHNAAGVTDFSASLDALIETAPNLAHVSLVVAWFGNSTDVAACTLRPGVEVTGKQTSPYEWKVGLTERDGAHLVSVIDGAPAFGGTPADRAVLEAIAALKAKGLKVMFHPFILMDMAGYPWRGRIDAGANDKTAAATSDIAAFFGSAAPGDFAIANAEVAYAGPAEWSFRRMILHYANLCALAGGVDAFLLGSELRGITTTRDAGDNFPAVAQLKSLAGDVRSILGSGTEISYGADWSEYFGFQPADGSGDVFFHLDDFWSDPNTDFVGIDNYTPLADWRDGFAHLDAIAGAASQYDLDYLMSNIDGGEGFDFFYASESDRDNQSRTTIADGAYGEPWVFRFKDLRSWWANAHHNRPGGVRDAAATSWVPESKPIRFTEIGAPAVDKGANQPNVFIDPKSVESAFPYFSNGSRDDLAQRRFLEAHGKFWREAANNPVSSLYAAPMLDAERQYVWTWDARPFPDFPARTDVWGDGPNWEKGHWLNGRLGRAPLDLLVTALAGEVGFTDVDTARLEGVVTGYVVDRPMSPRETIEPLADVFQFDMIEAGDTLRFQPRHGEPVLTIAASALGQRDEGAFSLSLAQELDLPAAFRLGFLNEAEDFAPAVAEARDPSANPARESAAEITAVLPAADAEARARSILADAWVMREGLEFELPPSQLAVEPGDAVILSDLAGDRRYRITEIEDGATRRAELVRVSPAVYNAPVGPAIFKPPATVSVFSAPVFELMDLPLFRDGDDAAKPWFAAFSDPWPGGVSLYREADGATPILAGVASARAVLGRLPNGLPPAASGRWHETEIALTLLFGALSSRAAEDVFAGANAFAAQSATGGWEICQFREATLQGDGSWLLKGLLRGQAGTEAESQAGADPDARFVLLSPAVGQAEFSQNLRGLSFDWSAGPQAELPGTENFTTKALALEARGLAPLAPVHLRATQEGGDLRLSWIRRTRQGGDAWEGEVPLSEAFERYRVSIFNGASEVRSAEVAAPEYIYASADIASDFPGGPGTSLTFAVAQISDAVGEGREGKESVKIG